MVAPPKQDEDKFNKMVDNFLNVALTNENQSIYLPAAAFTNVASQ